RGLKYLCEALANLDDVSVVIAGTGPEEEWVRKQCRSQRNLTFLGLLNEDESIESTRKSDVVFAFYDPRIPINRRAVSAKVFDAMMCQKPVLANREATLVADALMRNDCGIVVPYNDTAEIRAAVIKLKE